MSSGCSRHNRSGHRFADGEGGAHAGHGLLLTNSYDELMANVIEASMSAGRRRRVECEHLAFPRRRYGLQIWIETGTKPAPPQIVITSKTLAGAPQYTLRIKDWKRTRSPIADTLCSAAGWRDQGKPGFRVMVEFDELPPGHTRRAKK